MVGSRVTERISVFRDQLFIVVPFSGTLLSRSSPEQRRKSRYDRKVLA